MVHLHSIYLSGKLGQGGNGMRQPEEDGYFKQNQCSHVCEQILSHIVSYISCDNPKFVYVILSFPPSGLITRNHVF